MAKTLLVCAHPEYKTEKSEHIKKIYEELTQYQDVIGDYLPDNGEYNQEEQYKLLDEMDNMILLFPINWYNIPWLLSKYIARTWNSKHSLNKRKIYLIVTAGGAKENYDQRLGGANLDEFLNNLKATIATCDGVLSDEIIYYGAIQDNKEQFLPFLDEVKKFYKEKVALNK